MILVINFLIQIGAHAMVLDDQFIITKWKRWVLQMWLRMETLWAADIKETELRTGGRACSMYTKLFSQITVLWSRRITPVLPVRPGVINKKCNQGVTENVRLNYISEHYVAVNSVNSRIFLLLRMNTLLHSSEPESGTAWPYLEGVS